MSKQDPTPTLRAYLRVLRERRLLILATVVAAIAFSLAYSLLQEPRYEATATLNIQGQEQDLPLVGTPVAANVQPEKDVAAASRVVTRQDVVRRVAQELNTDLPQEELRDRISTTVEPDSNLLAIKAEDADAEFAASLANGFAEQTERVVQAEERNRLRGAARALQRQLDEGRIGDDPATASAYRTGISRLLTLSALAEPVAITRAAEVPGSPASPKPLRDGIIAALLGLIAGIGLAFLRNALDRRLTDPKEIQHEVGLPLVGYVRADALGMTGISSNGHSRVSEDDLEAFRILRTNVDFLATEKPSSVAVTSALPEEGKTTVACWYAYANAVAGRQTLLVECDLRRPTIAQRFGLEKGPGLSDYMSGDATPKEVLQAITVEGPQAVKLLPVITAGENILQPAEMIASARFGDFLDQVSRAYDLVVVDSAPLLPVGDTLELLPQVSAALFCVRLEQTTSDQATAARQAMAHLADKPTGLVVTGVRPGSEDDYYGYYSYTVSSPVQAEQTASAASPRGS